MPNTLITPSVVARATLGFWQNAAVLPSLFNRDYQSEFAGAAGDTITVRQQAALQANKFDRATGIVVQNVVENSVTLTVNDLYDVSVKVEQQEWDFDVFDFNWQFAEPAARGLVRKAEEVVAERLAAHSVSTALDPAKIVPGLIGARKKLNDAEVPLTDRFLVCGTGVAAKMLEDPLFIKANENGSDNALRNAQIGRVLGMPTYESAVIDEDEAYVCHKDAITFLSILPSLPRGAANASTSSYDGLGVRVVFDYDHTRKQDFVSWDGYYEAAYLRGQNAFVKLVLSTP